MADYGVYDIVGAFQYIEMDLIKSMQRNMKRHIGEEKEEGINWTQWQAEMLNGLAEYNAENAEMLPGYYKSINDEIDKAIKKAYATGESEQEIEMLKAIKDGFKPNVSSNAMQQAFFVTNRKKLNALIESTTKDFKKAESSILRFTDDVYRRTIFQSQMYYNSGAGSLYKAVDMATNDFLKSGINNIQYRNGARVNIASYAEMSMRTANKRANLMGSASKREEYGVHTVKITAHNSACPMCVQWQGLVYVDDVYGNGTKEESKKDGYMLLSEAVKGGMFHPNCKNGISGYYAGISNEPKKTTEEEAEKMQDNYMLEQRQRQCERNIRNYARLSAGSVDPDDIAKYKAKEKQWRREYNRLVKENSDVLVKDSARLKLYNIKI